MVSMVGLFKGLPRLQTLLCGEPIEAYGLHDLGSRCREKTPFL